MRSRKADLSLSRGFPEAVKVSSPRPNLFWDDQLEDLEGDPWDLAKSVGVNILSDKEFRAGFEVDGKIVAVLFDASTREEYSFDVAVAPEYRRRGLGKALVELALDTYEDNREAFGEDYALSLDVINPVMERLLRAMGFVEVGREGNHTLMTKLGKPWKRRWKPGKRQRRQRGKAKIKSRQYYRKNRAKIRRNQKRRRSRSSWKKNPARRRSEKLRGRQNRRRRGSMEVPSPERVAARNRGFSPVRERGGEGGQKQRRQKRVDQLKDHRYYKSHKSKIKRTNKLRYKTRCRRKTKCLKRREEYNKNPRFYKRRSPKYASVLTVPEIAFVIGKDMTLGYVDSVSPMSGMVTFRLKSSNVSQLNSLPVEVFLNAVTFLSEEDTQACFDLIDVEIGLEAYEDLDERGLRMCAGLYDVDPDSDEFRSKCRDLVGEDDFSSMAVADLGDINQELIVGVLEGGGVPRSQGDAEEHDEDIPSAYDPDLFYGEVEIQKTAGDIILYDQQSPANNEIKQPGDDVSYEATSPSHYRKKLDEKRGVPPGSDFPYGAENTPPASSRVIPDSMKDNLRDNLTYVQASRRVVARYSVRTWDTTVDQISRAIEELREARNEIGLQRRLVHKGVKNLKSMLGNSPEDRDIARVLYRAELALEGKDPHTTSFLSQLEQASRAYLRRFEGI